MKRILLFIVALSVLGLVPLMAQDLIFEQPYDAQGGVTSVFSTTDGLDYEVADNFSGLTDPIDDFTFYGLVGVYDGSAWVPGTPNATEPFFVKFYNYEEEWTQPPGADPGIEAPTTGTYTVRLYDSYGDGWNGGALDVYVEGVLVLDGITLETGSGPEDHTFDANAGEYILTVYSAGSYDSEVTYEILDPDLNVIATDGPYPEGIGVIPEPDLTAPVTGTYTVNLYDSFGDGWNGGALDVYVEGVLVLDGITLETGSGPESHTFAANAGDVIATVYYAGTWDGEVSYEILDPDLNVIATDGPGPTGIGFISTLVTLEPDWANPVHSYALNATTTFIEDLPWGGWSLYKFEVELPESVVMEDGWISAQIDADTGSGEWFLWVYGTGGDGSSWQRLPAVKNQTVKVSEVRGPNITKDVIPNDMAIELYTQPTGGLTFLVEAHDIADPTGPDINAEILFNGMPLVPPVFTPHTFTYPGDWQPGIYMVYDECYINWIPESIEFVDINTNYQVDFLGEYICGEPPTPVELSSFTAAVTADDNVQLTWVSQSENHMNGYVVYRNTSNTQSGSVMISTLIPATNTSTTQTYNHTDNEVEIDQTYYYWLEAVDYNSSSFHGPVSVIIEGNVPPVLPEVTSMKNAYPNPFKANTSIEVALKAGENGTVDIYNISGQVVRSFSVSEGLHTLNWDGRDTNGKACGSGIYFYKLSTPSLSQTKKMVIVK